MNSFAQLRNCPHLLIESLRTTKFGFAFTRCRQTGVNTLIKLDVERRMLDVRAAAREGPVAQRLEQGTHNSRLPKYRAVPPAARPMAASDMVIFDK